MSGFRVALFIGGLASLASACSGDSARPTPTVMATTPSQTSAPSATVTPARPARLAVYSAVARVEQTPAGRLSTAKIVAWDLDANRLSSTFEFGAADDPPAGAALAGSDIVYATWHRVTRADLNGANPKTLFSGPEGARIQDIAVSPDAMLVAVLLGSGSPVEPGELRVIDLRSGREIISVKQSDPRFAGMRGQFWQAQWRADNAGVLVHTATYSEMYGSLATVFLDGRARLEATVGFGNVSPTGTLLAGLGGQLGCMFVGSHAWLIRNLDDGSTPLHSADDNAIFTPWEWSPDGKEFVWLQQPARACDELSADRQAAWLVKTTDGKSFGAPESVPDLQALHRRWYGDHLFTLDCSPSREPVLNRWGDIRVSCAADPVDAVRKVLVGGRPAGEGMGIQPLGVIEP